MLTVFDNSKYRHEVIQRWGEAAYTESNNWFNSLSDSEKTQWLDYIKVLNKNWIDLAESGISADSVSAQEQAREHVEWLKSIPGTPAAKSAEALETYVRGLTDMYVSDSRFAKNYGGVAGASFVRDALNIYLNAGNN